MDEQRRLEEMMEATQTMGWRYLMEELSQYRDDLMETFLRAGDQRELGLVQGAISQIDTFLNTQDRLAIELKVLTEEVE